MIEQGGEIAVDSRRQRCRKRWILTEIELHVEQRRAGCRLLEAGVNLEGVLLVESLERFRIKSVALLEQLPDEFSDGVETGLIEYLPQKRRELFLQTLIEFVQSQIAALVEPE